MDLGLENARVLVTAASQGLGAATARRFSLEGARVVVNSRNHPALQQTAAAINAESGQPIFTLAADVADEASAKKLVNHAAEMLGGLDVLVINAGGPPGGSFTDFGDLAAWQAAVNLTLLSAVGLVQAALPHLRNSRRAAILAIVSIAAKQPVANLTLSNTLRPAVIGLTKTLSLELAPAIRVNSILPGMTDTERLVHLYGGRAERNGTTADDERAKDAGGIPMQRFGTPEEFANAAVFLCSPAAGYITGQALAVDGGLIRATM